jgi:hypothetical protein
MSRQPQAMGSTGETQVLLGRQDALLEWEGFSREAFVGLDILAGGVLDYIRGKLDSKARLVKVYLLEIVADELLVKRLLVTAWGILIGGPETRGVGRKHFIDQDYLITHDAELELRIGKDDASRLGIGRGFSEEFDALVADEFGVLLPDVLRCRGKIDVLVVRTKLRLGTGGKERFGQFAALLDAGGQLVTAHCPGGLVFLPAGTRQISANDALDGQDLRFLHEHGTACELLAGTAERIGVLRTVCGDEVVIDTSTEKIEPEERYLRQDNALARYAAFHYDVKGTETVGGHDKQLVAKIINIPYFAALGGQAGDLGFQDDCVHGNPFECRGQQWRI